MKIYITADHNGFKLKNNLWDWLVNEGYDVIDLGPRAFEKNDDYPDFGIELANQVAQGPDDSMGIAICGSGVGMAVVADKVPGIRAGLIHDVEIAKAARRDDDLNVLALGAQYINEADAKEVIKAWLTTDFSGEERHVRRINKIEQHENGHG